MKCIRKRLLIIIPIFTIFLKSEKAENDIYITNPKLIVDLSNICMQSDINKLSTDELLEKLNPLVSNADKIVQDVKEISAQELKQLIDSKQQNLKIINVLGKQYYNDCHILSEKPVESINWPLKTIINDAKNTQKNCKLITYCVFEDCNASQKAAIILKCLGFQDVYEYIGGMKEWYQNNFPTSGPCQCDYLFDTKYTGTT